MATSMGGDDEEAPSSEMRQQGEKENLEDSTTRNDDVPGKGQDDHRDKKEPSERSLSSSKRIRINSTVQEAGKDAVTPTALPQGNDNDDDESSKKEGESSSLLANADACTLFKYVYSTLLLLFCVVIVTALILDEGTSLAQDLHASVALILLWLSLLWLSLVEGGQGALVGLAPVEPQLYQRSHPQAFKCTRVGVDNLDRYLIGRQFLVVLIVFVTNQCGAPVDGNVSVLEMPNILQEVFVRSGLAIIFTTIVLGQLHSQVTAATCMLDSLNSRWMVFTLYVSLALETSGLLHAVYVLQRLVSAWSGKPIEQSAAEGPVEAAEAKSPMRWAYWGRVVFSFGVLFFALAVTLTALFQEQTNMWAGVPPAVSVVLFLLFIVLLGLLEGTQIAVFAVSRMPAAEQAKFPAAVKAMELLFANDGVNIPRFMIGRQIVVTLLMFIIARVTTVNVEVGVEDNIWGVPDGVQEFFNTGLLGAIIVTIVGSIVWKLVGSAFPAVFLSNPVVHWLLRLCLLLEASGVCAGAWVIAHFHAKCARLQPDQVYVGTPADRAATDQPDSLRFVDHDDGASVSVVSLREPTTQVGSGRYLQVEERSRGGASSKNTGTARVETLDDEEEDSPKSGPPRLPRVQSEDEEDNGYLPPLPPKRSPRASPKSAPKIHEGLEIFEIQLLADDMSELGMDISGGGGGIDLSNGGGVDVSQGGGPDDDEELPATAPPAVPQQRLFGRKKG